MQVCVDFVDEKGASTLILDRYQYDLFIVRTGRCNQTRLCPHVWCATQRFGGRLPFHQHPPLPCLEYPQPLDAVAMFYVRQRLFSIYRWATSRSSICKRMRAHDAHPCMQTPHQPRCWSHPAPAYLCAGPYASPHRNTHTGCDSCIAYPCVCMLHCLYRMVLHASLNPARADCGSCIGGGCGWCTSGYATEHSCKGGDVHGPSCDVCGNKTCGCDWHVVTCPVSIADLQVQQHPGAQRATKHTACAHQYIRQQHIQHKVQQRIATTRTTQSAPIHTATTHTTQSATTHTTQSAAAHTAWCRSLAELGFLRLCQSGMRVSDWCV
jgi:hypothetical protein